MWSITDYFLFFVHISPLANIQKHMHLNKLSWFKKLLANTVDQILFLLRSRMLKQNYGRSVELLIWRGSTFSTIQYIDFSFWFYMILHACSHVSYRINLLRLVYNISITYCKWSMVLEYVCNNTQPFKCRSGRRHFGLVLLWNLIMKLW